MEIKQAIHSSGNLHMLKPRKALNKAFLKLKPNRSQIESFKHNLIELLDRTIDTESEELHQVNNYSPWLDKKKIRVSANYAGS